MRSKWQSPASRLPHPPVQEHSYVESIDPATGEAIARFEVTEPAAIPAIMARARAAQDGVGAAARLSSGARLCGACATRFSMAAKRSSASSRARRASRASRRFSRKSCWRSTPRTISLRHAPRWLRPRRVPHHNIALKAKSGWIEHEPLGVVAIIAPWNYPFAIPMAELIPALLAGNAVVLKPSELTPWTGSAIGELCRSRRFAGGSGADRARRARDRSAH